MASSSTKATTTGSREPSVALKKARNRWAQDHDAGFQDSMQFIRQLRSGTVGTHTLDFIPPHKMVIELPEELVAKVMSFTSDMARLFALEARRKGLLMSNSAKNPENIKEAKETLREIKPLQKSTRKEMKSIFEAIVSWRGGKILEYVEKVAKAEPALTRLLDIYKTPQYSPECATTGDAGSAEGGRRRRRRREGKKANGKGKERNEERLTEEEKAELEWSDEADEEIIDEEKGITEGIDKVQDECPEEAKASTEGNDKVEEETTDEAEAEKPKEADEVVE